MDIFCARTFHKFQTFKAFVEKPTRLFIKCLRTNRGGDSIQLHSKNSVKRMQSKDS